MEQKGLDVGEVGDHSRAPSKESGSHSDSGSAGPPPRGSQNAQNKKKKECTKEERIIFKMKKS